MEVNQPLYRTAGRLINAASPPPRLSPPAPPRLSQSAPPRLPVAAPFRGGAGRARRIGGLRPRRGFCGAGGRCGALRARVMSALVAGRRPSRVRVKRGAQSGAPRCVGCRRGEPSPEAAGLARRFPRAARGAWRAGGSPPGRKSKSLGRIRLAAGRRLRSWKGPGGPGTESRLSRTAAGIFPRACIGQFRGRSPAVYRQP